MTTRTFKIELEISTGTWDVDLVEVREPTPIIVSTFTNRKSFDVVLENAKYYALRYLIVAPKGKKYKFKLQGSEIYEGTIGEGNKMIGEFIL
ncbi:MAG: hypothetical protein ABJH06_17745 [Paraglaciecola sp.]|uniref:hypothetical protein n=1 Tax=Paraglaciecola sp. TaxID=1920173 RepID=UPI003298A047